MRTISIVAITILTLGLLGRAAAVTPEQRLKREQEKLAGVWRVTGMQVNGTILPARQVPDLKLTFKDGKFTVRLGKEKPQEGTYKIDPSKKPKTIDIINGKTDKEKDKDQVGIYELIGNSLRICACPVGSERPTDFTTNDKPGYTVLILKREP
jgi:uncharacterized protein (TIGR03067 family)